MALKLRVNPEEFRSVGDPAPTTNPRGVHQAPALALPLDLRINGIPGGATHRADNGAGFTTNGVQQTGLAHVGSADNGQLNGLHVLILVLLGEQFPQPIQQISSPHTVDTGNRMGLTQVQTPEVGGQGQRPSGEIHTC